MEFLPSLIHRCGREDQFMHRFSLATGIRSLSQMMHLNVVRQIGHHIPLLLLDSSLMVQIYIYILHVLHHDMFIELAANQCPDRIGERLAQA